MNTGDREKIVIGGKEWHKDCYDSTRRGGYTSPKPVPQVDLAETVCTLPLASSLQQPHIL